MTSIPKCLSLLRNELEIRPRLELDVPKGFYRAAVLVPFLCRQKQWILIFTRRTDLVSQHKNEISFPGGKFDVEDKTLTQTALREANEEVGISQVDIIGKLDDIITISKYIVTPVVGWIKNAKNYYELINRPEINYIIETPLLELSKKENFSIKEVPYQNGYIFHVPFFDYQNEIIWGATGRILVSLLNQINKLPLNCRKKILGVQRWEGADNEEVAYHYAQVKSLISPERRES
ncbi:MAG: CoA pyrophosphatase [Candidatus Heimdallarchaeota archaeon]|nr:CoA pyrophosphatase [Candidatus Heimdallarchaeota archaeon]